jgi:hypothetical protein
MSHKTFNAAEAISTLAERPKPRNMPTARIISLFCKARAICTVLLLAGSCASATVAQQAGEATSQSNNYYQGGRHVILDKEISKRRIACEGKPEVLAACNNGLIDEDNCIMECVLSEALQTLGNTGLFFTLECYK